MLAPNINPKTVSPKCVLLFISYLILTFLTFSTLDIVTFNFRTNTVHTIKDFCPVTYKTYIISFHIECELNYQTVRVLVNQTSYS